MGWVGSPQTTPQRTDLRWGSTLLARASTTSQLGVRTNQPCACLRDMSASACFNFREPWQAIKRGRPGHRFRDRHTRARRGDRRPGAAKRIVLIVVGLIALVVGMVLVVIPGPGLPFLFLAGGLLATESRIVARFMDWSEVRGRRLGGWGKRHWHRFPTAARAALVVLGACGSAASMYLMYRFVRG